MLTGGTALTAQIARRKGRICRVWDLQEESDPADIVRWIAANRIRVLNVAGPRESQSPGIYQQAYTVLATVFGQLEL